MKRRVSILLAAAAASVAVVQAASADGEVGLVLQEGDAVTTYCVAYEGGGISGEALLERAGLAVEQFGGSGARTVCAIGGTGCSDASSFASCFCQCQGGDCTYWAFFTREYGAAWVYSSLGFNLLQAQDGDVHGWKWGKGGPNSAPAPAEVTFEQVCGHAPRGGVDPATPEQPTAVAPPEVTLTAPAATSTVAGPANPPGTSPTAPRSGGGANTPDAGSTLTVTSGVTITAGKTAPAAESTAEREGEDGGSGAGNIIAFGVVAVLLAGAIGGAAWWRQRGR